MRNVLPYSKLRSGKTVCVKHASCKGLFPTAQVLGDPGSFSVSELCRGGLCSCPLHSSLETLHRLGTPANRPFTLHGKSWPHRQRGKEISYTVIFWLYGLWDQLSSGDDIALPGYNPRTTLPGENDDAHDDLRTFSDNNWDQQAQQQRWYIFHTRRRTILLAPGHRS